MKKEDVKRKPSFCPMKMCEFLALQGDPKEYPAKGFICIGKCPNTTITYGVEHPNTHNFCIWTSSGWHKFQINQADAYMISTLLLEVPSGGT